MKPKSIAIPAACLVAGVLIGRLLPEPSFETPVLTEGYPEPTATGQAHTKASKRTTPDWPASANPQTPDDPKTTTTEAVGDGKMVWIPASLLEALSRSAATRTAGQNLFTGDAVEDILQITDQEKAMIQTAWSDTQQQLRDLEARAMTSEVTDDGSVVTITLPDLTNRTGEIGNRFGQAVRNSLGENRSEVFLTIKQVDQIFAPEPGERTYRIEPEETGDCGWRYHLTLEDPAGRHHLSDTAHIRRSLADE